MEQGQIEKAITKRQFKKFLHEQIVAFLIMFVGYSVYKIIVGSRASEYIIILSISFICIILCYFYLYAVTEKSGVKNFLYGLIFDFIFIIVMGLLAMYLSFYKSGWGIIKLFVYGTEGNFILNLLFYLVTLPITFMFLKNVGIFQGIYKKIRGDKLKVVA